MKIKPILFMVVLMLTVLNLEGCIIGESRDDRNLLYRPSVPFIVIAEGGSRGVTSKRLEVIRDESSFGHLLAAVPLFGSQVPFVDFRQDMVIAAFLGKSGPGGHHIGISYIEEEPDHIAVSVFTRIPGPRCPVPMMMISTNPFVIVKIPQSSKLVTFSESAQVADCL
jgi:hypothetical protein